MRLTKTTNAAHLAQFDRPMPAFSQPVKVQGGTRSSAENMLLVQSGGRFKLFTDGCDLVKIVRGSGHFKWARGETAFCEGEVFLLEQVGEYELNGACDALIIRE